MRAKTPEERKLLEIFDPIAETLALNIVRVRLQGSRQPGGARFLQIMAERKTDGEINVTQCARLSRAISAYIDEADPIPGEFTLEVSSPGIDRPLTRLVDFDTYQGLEARIELDRLAEGRKRFRGILAGIEDTPEGGHVAIDLEGEEDTALMPFDWIIDAKLILNDELMKRGAEAKAAHGDEEEDEDFEGFDDEDLDGPANDDK